MSPEHSLLSDLSVPLLDSWREPNMPNSPVCGQHCRCSVFEVNAKEKSRGFHHMRLPGFRDRPFNVTA